MIPVLLAVTGAPWEATLVARMDRVPGVTVVRRCVDVADLLAAASTGQARAVLVAEQLARLDSEVVARLHQLDVDVVGLVGAGEDPAAGTDLAGVAGGAPASAVDAGNRLFAMGVRHIADATGDPDDLARVLREATDAADERNGSFGSERAEASDGPPRTDAWRALDAPGPPDVRPATGPASPAGPAGSPGPQPWGGRGRLIAVWGPTGSPGRTTVAVGLAAELAAVGTPTLLADVDPYGGTVAQTLGMLDEASGLASAVRSAASGTLDAGVLARQTRQVGPQLLVLIGLSRADRWPELRPHALAGLWENARTLAAVTVADCGFSLEADEELSFDTLAPQRNGATLTTLEEADEVVVVGSADPVGLARLVRGIHELDDLVPGTPKRIVLNRARPGVFATAPEDAARQALTEYATAPPLAAVLPYDRSALDTAMRHGNTLVEAARSSKLRKALQGLAAELLRPVHA